MGFMIEILIITSGVVGEGVTGREEERLAAVERTLFSLWLVHIWIVIFGAGVVVFIF